MINWLETIEVQSIIKQRTELENTLEDLLKQLRKPANQPQINIFYKHGIESDYMIQINNTQQFAEAGSPLGIHIANILKEYGLVNHTIWVGRTDFQK